MTTIALDIEAIGPFVFDNHKDHSIENYPHRVRVEDSTEIHRWCIANIKPKDWTVRMPHFAFIVEYCFRNGADATAFKLRFLGSLRPGLSK